MNSFNIEIIFTIICKVQYLDLCLQLNCDVHLYVIMLCNIYEEEMNEFTFQLCNITDQKVCL